MELETSNSLIIIVAVFDDGKGFQFNFLAEKPFPPGGDFSSPNTRSYHMISESVAAKLTRSVVL